MENGLTTIQNKLFLILSSAILIMLLAQFIILGTVGTIGPELSSIRAQQEQLKLENEIKLAKIRELQTTNEVSADVMADLGMEEADLNNIYLNSENQLTAKAY